MAESVKLKNPNTPSSLVGLIATRYQVITISYGGYSQANVSGEKLEHDNGYKLETSCILYTLTRVQFT